MKYYESTFEEYLNSLDCYNLHNNVNSLIDKLPNDTNNLNNFIFFGPSGSGKYSQVLNLLKKYSPSQLKYNNKVMLYTEKQNYKYNISDIHYEIDMELLGCHSKLLWHELFLQIIDIIYTKTDKFGFIFYKNFHHIHNELLDIFYSYIQHYSYKNSIIKLYFIIITENISFLNNNIINSSIIVNIEKPQNKDTVNILKNNDKIKIKVNKIDDHNILELYKKYISNYIVVKNDINIKKIQDDNSEVNNLKKIKNYHFMKHDSNIDYKNIICNNIIKLMIDKNIDLNEFRENIYDIFIYNLDIISCIWYIFSYFIDKELLKKESISNILFLLNNYLLYLNNNYRPIYHLEIILINIIDNLDNGI